MLFILSSKVEIVKGSSKYSILVNLLRMINFMKKNYIQALFACLIIGLFILVVGHKAPKWKKIAIVDFFCLVPILYTLAIYILAGIYTFILYKV